MGPKSGSAESIRKSINDIKCMNDLACIQRGKQTIIGDNQQPEEQEKRVQKTVVNTKGQHMQRQCPAFGKTCSTCDKQNHFIAVCQDGTLFHFCGAILGKYPTHIYLV